VSSPFLVAFVEAVVHRLLAEEQIEIVPGNTPVVVESVASSLGSASNQSLVSTLSGALIRCEHVEEFYVDDEELKEIITSLSSSALPRGGPS